MTKTPFPRKAIIFDQYFDFIQKMHQKFNVCWTMLIPSKSSPFHEYFNSIEVNFNCSITDFVPLSDDRLERFQENIDFDIYKDLLTVPFTGTLNPVPFAYSV